MARINVDDYAFDDPRFDILAASLRTMRDRWHALGCCLRIWHLCASRHTDTLRPVELAICLGVRKPLTSEAQELAVSAFVDTADLGEWQGEVIRICSNLWCQYTRMQERVADHGPRLDQ